MGTEISLDIGGISIAWAKNHRGADYGFLFQADDRHRYGSDQLNYDAVEEDDPDRAEMEVGFTRFLHSAVSRLELLGYTLPAAAAEYRRAAAASLEERKAYREDYGDGNDPPSDVMSFEELRTFVTGVSLADLDDTFDHRRGDDHDRRIMGRFADEAFKSKLPHYEDTYDRMAWSERSYFGSLIAFLHPFTQLRLLAESPHNLEARLEWQYGPLVANGWANESEFTPDARRTQTYLIATEGSSDIYILKRAFQLLRPDVTDFFRFIDVSERHPFSGTGGLVKFADGLAKIDVHNRTVFLLDNDAEGVSAFRKIGDIMPLPVNMRALTLPDLDELNAIRCVGPDGETTANINGRAAAIECYLDLEAEGVPSPLVRWTNFKDDVVGYQGVLQQKDRYSKAFFDKVGRGKTYDTRKLSAALEAIVNVCTSMATDMLLDSGDTQRKWAAPRSRPELHGR